jgi:hypothetical protein
MFRFSSETAWSCLALFVPRVVSSDVARGCSMEEGRSQVDLEGLVGEVRAGNLWLLRSCLSALFSSRDLHDL